MKRKIIPDEEISLNNDNDLLKTKEYANSLVKIIYNTPANKVFTIGLFGTWGSGKSSIIKTAKETLENNKEKIKFITYDAWKYTKDSFRRMFLLEIQKKLHLEQTSDMQRFYQSTNEETEVKQVLNPGHPIKLLFIICFLIMLIIGLAFLPDEKINPNLKITLQTILTFLSLIVAIVQGLFYNLKVSIDKPLLFAPEQFEECFNEMMTKVLKRKNKKKIENFINYVFPLKKNDKNIDKLVIVIDNMDRCDGNTVYTLLSDIKSFLSNEAFGIIFIIPLDDNVLKNSLPSYNCRGNGDKEKEEFLRKVFNLVVRIKPHQATEMFSFTHKINKNYMLNYNNETLSIISRELSSNPRRIIQFLNNLSSELCLFNEKFAQENETLICIILMLREEYNDFYNKILKDRNILFNYEKEESEDLKRLLSISKHTLENVNASLISQILTNTEAQFSNISDDLKNKINGYSTEVLNLLDGESGEKKAEVVQYVLKNIEDEAKYGAEMQVTNWIDYVAYIIVNNNNFFDKNDFIHLDSLLNKYYDFIVIKTGNLENLCNLIIIFRKANLKNLQKSLYKHTNNITDFSNKKNNNTVHILLTKLGTAEDSQGLHTFFENVAKNIKLPDIEYTEPQKKHFFTSKYINSAIDNLINFDLENHDTWNLLLSLKNNISFTNTYYNNFIVQLISILPKKNTESIEKYNNIIFSLLSFCNLIDSIGNNDPLLNLYSKIFENFQSGSITLNTASNAMAQSISAGSITHMNSQLDNIKALKAICDLTFKIYLITNTVSPIMLQQIKIIYAKEKDSIISNLIELIKKKYSLIPFWSIISQMSSTANEVVEFIEYCFNEKTDITGHALTEDQIRVEINALLNTISAKNIFQLLRNLCKINNVEKIIQEELTKVDENIYKNLPSSLRKLAVTYFNEETKNVCKDRYKYLKFLATNGNAVQKELLWNLLDSQLSPHQKKTIFINILNVLLDFKVDSMHLKNVILAEMHKNSKLNYPHDIKILMQKVIQGIESQEISTGLLN